MAKENFDKKFYDSSWSRWFDMKKFGPMSRHTRRLCFGIIKKLNVNSMLDIGCGEGSFLRFVASKNPKIVLSGADISQTAINNAEENFPGSKFYIVDFEKEYLQEKYDLITAIDVIEHINNDVNFLKNLSKMSGKYLLICTLLGKMRPFEKIMGHVRNYSFDELLTKIKSAGFYIVKAKKWGFPFYSPLYRDLCQALPQNTSEGKFGFLKKAAAIFLYLVFFLNLNFKGDLILVLAKIKNGEKDEK